MKPLERCHCKCADGLWRIGFKDKKVWYFDGTRGAFPEDFVIETVEFPRG